MALDVGNHFLKSGTAAIRVEPRVSEAVRLYPHSSNSVCV